MFTAMDLKTYLENNTQTDLARQLGVSQGLIHQWVTGKTRITGERAKQIELATMKKITRRELRPDLFGDDEADAGTVDVPHLRRATDTYPHPSHGDPDADC